MTAALSSFWAGAVGVVKRDLAIFTSYRLAFVTQILANLFSLTLFFYISRLVTIGEFESPDAYYATRWWGCAAGPAQVRESVDRW